LSQSPHEPRSKRGFAITSRFCQADRCSRKVSVRSAADNDRAGRAADELERQGLSASRPALGPPHLLEFRCVIRKGGINDGPR
jgi:hypothetical protein